MGLDPVAGGLLEKVEATADLDCPAVIDADFTIVHVGVELHVEFNVDLQQALDQIVGASSRMLKSLFED